MRTKIIIIALVFVIIVLIGGAGLWYWKSNDLRKSSNIPTESSRPGENQNANANREFAFDSLKPNAEIQIHQNEAAPVYSARTSIFSADGSSPVRISIVDMNNNFVAEGTVTLTDDLVLSKQTSLKIGNTYSAKVEIRADGMIDVAQRINGTLRVLDYSDAPPVREIVSFPVTLILKP